MPFLCLAFQASLICKSERYRAILWVKQASRQHLDRDSQLQAPSPF